MSAPFLFRFKKNCESPSRAGRDSSYTYDSKVDMVMDSVANPTLPAIDSDRLPGPQTKKKDLEKGEDQKDRRMWQ